MQSVSVIDQKQQLIEEATRSFEQKIGTMQESLEIKDYEIRDLQDKLQASAKEVKFYKKGYLEEVSEYKVQIEKLQTQLREQKESLTL